MEPAEPEGQAVLEELAARAGQGGQGGLARPEARGQFHLQFSQSQSRRGPSVFPFGGRGITTITIITIGGIRGCGAAESALRRLRCRNPRQPQHLTFVVVLLAKVAAIAGLDNTLPSGKVLSPIRLEDVMA